MRKISGLVIICIIFGIIAISIPIVITVSQPPSLEYLAPRFNVTAYASGDHFFTKGDIYSLSDHQKFRAAYKFVWTENNFNDSSVGGMLSGIFMREVDLPLTCYDNIREDNMNVKVKIIAEDQYGNEYSSDFVNVCYAPDFALEVYWHNERAYAQGSIKCTTRHQWFQWEYKFHWMVDNRSHSERITNDLYYYPIKYSYLPESLEIMTCDKIPIDAINIKVRIIATDQHGHEYCSPYVYLSDDKIEYIPYHER